MISKLTFNDFIQAFTPQHRMASVRHVIWIKYDCINALCNDGWRLCVSTLIQDSAFACNTRQLYDAYAGKVYIMQYLFSCILI